MENKYYNKIKREEEYSKISEEMGSSGVKICSRRTRGKSGHLTVGTQFSSSCRFQKYFLSRN
jgi:hypothetical protein